MKIGVWELVVVFIVALLVIGPDKLPEYAKKLGEALRQFKKYSSEATKEIRESVVEPLQEAQRPLREAMEPLNDLEKSVRGEVDDLKKSFEEIGKPPRIKPDTGTPVPTGPVVEEPAAAGTDDTGEASGLPEDGGTPEAKRDQTEDNSPAESEKNKAEEGAASEPEKNMTEGSAAAVEEKTEDPGAAGPADDNANSEKPEGETSAEV